MIRIYIKSAHFEPHAELDLSPYHSHYLSSVMRVKNGDNILIFNESFGEYTASIADSHHKKTRIRILTKVRDAAVVFNRLNLAYAPIKNPNSSFIIQKATELGVSEIFPIATDYTVVRKINREKIEQTAIEASEQCMRLSIPIIHDIQSFTNFIAPFSKVSGGEKYLIFCDEHCKSPHIAELNLINEKTKHPAEYIVIIGPEGGFSDKERQLIAKCTNSIIVSLGENILRAETAMIYALSHLSYKILSNNPNQRHN